MAAGKAQTAPQLGDRVAYVNKAGHEKLAFIIATPTTYQPEGYAASDQRIFLTFDH